MHAWGQRAAGAPLTEQCGSPDRPAQAHCRSSTVPCSLIRTEGTDTWCHCRPRPRCHRPRNQCRRVHHPLTTAHHCVRTRERQQRAHATHRCTACRGHLTLTPAPPPGGTAMAAHAHTSLAWRTGAGMRLLLRARPPCLNTCSCASDKSRQRASCRACSAGAATRWPTPDRYFNKAG